jgi:O-antigen ligase
VFDRHPVTGAGYHSLATASVGHVPVGWPLSPLAHNGYLQALSDGGLLLAVPFLGAVVAVCWWVLRSLGQAVRRRDLSTLGLAVPVSLGVMLVHSAVDFDWSYAADFVLGAILAGLVLGTRRGETAPRTAPSRRVARVVAVAVLAGVALTGVAAVAARGGDLRQSLPISAAGGTR